MEGRTSLPESAAAATPLYSSPAPPPHGTVPAPAPVTSDSSHFSPVFADLPAGPNASTRASTASSVSSPGHASYQGKIFPSSVTALVGASGFSHLSNFISPACSDSFKTSTIVPQAAGMNQYWLQNSEGYSGFPVGGAHPYQSYFTSLQAVGPQGLLAVSTTAKSEGQRIPASYYTRGNDPWEGPPSKVPKILSYGLKDSALSPKASTHKSRHVSGNEDAKISRHDSSRSKAKEKLTDAIVVDEKRDSSNNRSNRSNVKEGTSPTGPKQELKSDVEVNRDLKKVERFSDLKQSVPSNPGTLTVDVNNSLEEPSSLVSTCNGDRSPKKDGSRASTSLTSVSPKSKESGMEKRKKAGKRKDLSVDVNGNAVLQNVPVVEDKKSVPQTSNTVYESKNDLYLKEAENVSTEPEGSEKLQSVLTDSSTNGIHRTSLITDTVPLVSNMVPSEKCSPPSALCKVTRQASPPLLSTAVRSPFQGTSSATTPSETKTQEAVVPVQTSLCRVIVSTGIGNCVERSSPPGDNPTSGFSTKSDPPTDNLKQSNTSDASSSRASPVPASNFKIRCSVGETASSPTNSHSTDIDPSGISYIGLKRSVTNPSVVNPKEANPKGACLAGINPPGESLSQLNPTSPSDVRTTEAYLAEANPLPAIPPCTNPTRLSPTGYNPIKLSPTGSKPSRTSPFNKASLCSPQSTSSGDSTRDSPVEKEKLASPRSLASTTFSTCVTSSVSKPISFPAHAPLPSPSSQSQPPYISHLPIYLHGTGHLSLEREVNRETPRDGSKVHATTFVPALGEFIPGPASSATIPAKESKTKTSSSGKDSSHGPVVSEKEKDKTAKKDAGKTGVSSTRDLVVSPPKSELTSDKAKLGGSPQHEAGTKSKEITESKVTLGKGKSEKADKHEKSKRSHLSNKPSHEGRDHHLSPSEFSGKDRGVENALRTGVDSIHRETCRTSDAAIISTTPSVHSYAHHMASFPVNLGSMASSSRDGSKLDVPSSIYSSEEQRRYMEWHMAASKRGYCYDHPGIRLPSQEPAKLDSTMMQRTLHQPSFPSPRTESRPELIPEHTRSRDFPSYASPQDSMLRSVLTAGMHQVHSETQHTSPGSASKSNKLSCDSKTENRSKSASHGSIKAPSEGLGSQGRSTPGTKGSDGRNPPVGIAVAQKRQDSESVSQGRSSAITASRNNSPHIGSEDPEDRGGRTRQIHGPDRDTKHRDHSPRSHREAADLLPPTKYHHHRFPGELGSNLIVTGGTGLGPSPHHFDPTEGRMTPSHPSHLTLPPPWLPRAPGPPHTSSLWLGHPFGLATPPASALHAGEGTPGHLQMPPAGFQIARDPTTGQLVLVPQAVHSDSGVPTNLSMWPSYLVPPHLQPHSHQLQQLVLNQPSFGPPVPHQAPHPLTHRPDQQLPSADYHFALQQHQEALVQWYRQDEQRQREEQRRREQQSRKSNAEKSSEKNHKSSSGGDAKSESHAEKQSGMHDVLNLKIPPHASYLPGVPLPGQQPVPYVYPPQQVQYLYNHAGVFPTPAVSCNSSPRTESGASTASPKQTMTKSGAGSDRTQTSKSDSILKMPLKSISVQTSPSETPASVDFCEESKSSNQDDEQSSSGKTDDSEDQELIIVDVVSDDVCESPLFLRPAFTQDKDLTQTNTDTDPLPLEVKPVEHLRTSNLSLTSNLTTEDPSEVNSNLTITDLTMTEKTVTETPPPNMPPPDTPQISQESVLVLEEPGKESLISNVLTTTQSFASRMEALDQDQLAAIEGIALLSEVADQKAFSVCSESDKASSGQSSQTRDDSYLLDNRHQDNGTPLQGNTASAVTSASGGPLPLITQSCPTSPTEFIFKRSSSSEGVQNFNSPGDLMNPNEVEMRQRLAELQRKYQEKKRELDKLQRKKDKKDKGSRSLDVDRRRGPGRPRKHKLTKDCPSQETRPCPMIKSSTAVLLEAAASLEENSPFVVPKKKKKRDREDKEKGKTDEKKKSKKDKEISKSKKKKHRMKEEMQESSLSSEDISSTSGSKLKSKSKTKSKTLSGLASSKDVKQKATSRSRKISPNESGSSDSMTKPSKSPKNGGILRSPRSHNSSTDFDTDSSSIIWPGTSTNSLSIALMTSSSSSSKSKSKSSKKRNKDSKTGKNPKKGSTLHDSPSDCTMEAIKHVIRKLSGGQDQKDRGNRTPQSLLHMYEDDSDSPWETAIIDAKQKRNLAGQTQQKGLALLAGISSQELMKNALPGKEIKMASSKDPGDAKSDADSSKRKSGKAKKRSLSPASSEQGTPKKSKKMYPNSVKKEKDFECPSKFPKSSTKQVKKKEKTHNECKSAPIKQEEKPFFNEEIWSRRRSERIFLSDISPGTSRDVSPHTKGLDNAKTTKKPGQTLRVKTQSESSSAGEQGGNTDHNSVANIGSVLDALKTDTLQIRKKLASMSAQEDEQDDAPRKTKKKLSKRRDQAKKTGSKQDLRIDWKRSKQESETQDSSCSEAENLPLSNLVDRQTPPAPRSCLIEKEELQNGLRVLTLIDGLFYAGYVSAIQPPDVYGVILDGERGNRPHVFSQEQILQETFVDVKPLSTRYVPEGTRVCAYWSQQFRCLYPGTVVKGTPNPNEDPNFVCVEFDDGDSGRIPVDHIRMLPHDYPIVEFEPIPTELQRRRRRRTSDTSSTANYKQDSVSEDTSASKAKNSSPKKKPKLTDPSKSSLNQLEMDKISESGEDDVFLPHSPKVQNKSKKSKNHDKSKKSSKIDSKIREKRKKKKRKREERRQELADRKRSKRSSSKSPRGSPARSPSRSTSKSKKKKRKEDRKKKNFTKLNSTNTESSPSSLKTKSTKKKSSSSYSIKKKSHRDEKHSSFCTVETETVYSTHPITGSQVLTEEDTSSETPAFDGGKGVWSKHRDTRDHSLDDWSSSDSSKDSSSDSDETTSESMSSSKDNIPVPSSHKRRSSCLPSTSKMTAFLPARQLWNWFGKATQRRGAKGKARKVFYRAIMRENEIIRQGDAAVFLSTGRPHLPYIGRIESMWESWGGNMVVRVKWFYHPEETKGGRKSHDGKMALYQSLHVDENDVQTISHKCEVLSVDEYKRYASGKKPKYTTDSEDMYYLAGTYDPTSGHITSVT